jgi:hypothetical protein
MAELPWNVALSLTLQVKAGSLNSRCLRSRLVFGRASDGSYDPSLARAR